MCVLLVLALPQADGASAFASYPGRVWPLTLLAMGTLLVVVGIWTRPVAWALALTWVWAMCSGLRAGQAWNSLPIRAGLFAILFGTIALSGPGRFAIDWDPLSGISNRK